MSQVPEATERADSATTRANPTPRRSLRLRPQTFVTLGFALLGTFLAWADPFDEHDRNPVITSSKTAARRLFPTLVDADPNRATIELQAPDRPLVRLVPGPEGGHQVISGDELLGPANPDSFEGVWSSLRMATIIREVNELRSGDETRSIGQRGVVRVILPDGNFTIALGNRVANGGVYAKLEGQDGSLVVEESVAWIVDQPARKWLSGRLMDVEPERVTSLAWGAGSELVLGRGDDGYWRVRLGAAPALLSNAAVDARLGHLLRSELDPFFERDTVPTESMRPWLAVTSDDGSSRTLLVGGPCPGHPDKRLVDRGPGLVGCLPEADLDPWPLDDPDAGMIESRLIPHAYGRIVQIDLERPESRSLIRRGGKWSVSETGEVEAVSENEVRRWFTNLARVEVAPLSALAPGDGAPEESPPDDGPPEPGPGDDDDPLAPFVGDTSLAIHTDTDETLRVACRLAEDPVICVRDEGPQLRVLGELPRNLAFDSETFAERRLVSFSPGSVRELEIMPASPDSPVVRQSVRADMGVWELDQPSHPDGSGAIDEVRLETVLWALGQLRSEGWAPAPDGPPIRQLVVEVVPETGPKRSEIVLLFDDCVAGVEGHRPALLSSAHCDALHSDILFDDPLRFWLERSRSLEVRAADLDPSAGGVFLRRERGQFVTDDDRPLEDPALEAMLQAWIDWRSAGLRAGEPHTPLEFSLDIRRDAGPRVQVDVGDGWVRLRGADWHYLQRASTNGDEPAELERPPEDFDHGAIPVD